MDEIENILNTTGTEAVQQLQQVIRSKARASGALANSISYDVKDGTLQIKAAEHLPWALFGRGPGKAPPRKAIKRWIDEKGIVSEISRQSLAYLIQRKIAQEGTEGVISGGGTLGEFVLTPALLSEMKTNLKTFLKTSLVQQMRTAFNSK